MQTGQHNKPQISLTGATPRILVVEARYYERVNDALWQGAETALKNSGASFERVQVAGALEIPAAISIAHQAKQAFDGYVALGCVIRGETTHYELVSEQSCAGLMALGVKHGLAIGNGILTVENKAQAFARANMNEQDKGGGAVLACLSLIQLKRQVAK